MKYNRIIISAACSALMLASASCDGWLDIQPKGFTIPSKYSDYEQLMNGQGLYRSLDIYPSYITDDVMFVATGTVPKISAFEYMNQSELARNLYSFEHGQVLTPGNSDDIWDGCYSNIFTYNAVINNVRTSEGGTQKERDQVYGEALVGRAFEYLNLVNVYGNHYDAATAATDYGVPIVLSEGITGEKYPRASVAEVYAQIKKDLDEALPYLAERTATTFDPSQSVGYAFLARMYLYMGDYAKALENANASLAQNDELLDYNLYKATQGQWGRLVKADGSGEEFPDEHENVENVYTRVLQGTSYLFKQVAASESLLETFRRNLPEGSKDMRKELFFATDEFNPYTVGGSPDIFTGYTIFAPYIEMNIGFSTPEVYLIAAECEARIGDKNKAIGYLNRLRDNRISDNVALSTSFTKEEVLEMVIDERRKEFAFVGLTRLIALKRLNRESWFARTIHHDAGSEGSWELPPNDPRYIMPVPETILSFNDMPQYER